MKGYIYRFDICRVPKSSNGFTLVELLVAMALTTIVVNVTGFGIVNIMSRNNKQEAETERRVNLNRALDFIADEIRMANRIDAASDYSFSSQSPTCATATPVLHLTIPNGVTTRNIVYYVNDLSGCISSSSIWLKPIVIKRIDNVTTTSLAGGSGSELVDAVATPSNPPTSASCSSTLNSPTFGGTKGFYRCIDSSNRTIQLFLYGKISDDTNGVGSYTNTYPVNTIVFARSQ